MRNILRILGGMSGLIFLVILEIGLSYILPYPYSKINIIFAILIIVMIWRKSGMVVWLSFFSNFIVELFTASPFGLILFSSTIGILFGYWFFQNIFTNRSWFASMVLTVITLFIYQFLYITGIVLLYFLGRISYVPWQVILMTFFWEEVFTLALVGILYAFLSYFFREFRSSVIEAQRFKV